jgi:YbbR domain-containing protein
MRRALRVITHNWPLKLGAVALATLLYGGLVVSQTTVAFPGTIQIRPVNQPAGTIVLTNLGAVSGIRYVAPPDLGLRIDSQSFQATVDLAGTVATGQPATLDVNVEAADARIQVLDFEPKRILVTVDRVGTKTVPVRVSLGPVPSGLDVGDPVVDVKTADVSGPQSKVDTVVEVEAPVSIDASGIDVDQSVALVALDDTGTELGVDSRIEINPTRARVQVQVFTDRRSKPVPVTPNVIGTPAAGFEIASIDVSPPIVSVQGDANDLASLDRADTSPVSISGASSAVTQDVGFALPTGVQALNISTVKVTVRLRPVTATRNFEAGLVLVGARADLDYTLSSDRVVVTIGGSITELDRLSGSTLVLTLDVSGLDPGKHQVTATANLTTGLSLISASPNPITVTVSNPAASPSPAPS